MFDLAPLRRVRDIARACGLFSPRMVGLLGGYYALTPLNAAADGLSWVLLVSVFSSKAGLAADGSQDLYFMRFLAKLGVPLDGNSLLLLVGILFLAKAAMTIVILGCEAAAQAEARRRTQERCLSKLMHGRWEVLRGGSVGQWVGAVTEEGSAFSYYFICWARALYCFATFALLAAMAFFIEPQLNLLMLAVIVPAWALLRYLYKGQADMSSRYTQARQQFSVDVTERLSGLFQIKAFGDVAPHLRAGLREQGEYTRAEIVLGYYNGFINAFNPLLFPAIFFVYYLWTVYHGQTIGSQLHILGSVGILGQRAAGQLNTFVGTIGNLARYSGSVEPIARLCALEPEADRKPLPEALASIRLEGVRYSFHGREVVAAQDLTVAKGGIFLITGPSGAGKTTLANLIVGLYEPASGKVLYVGASGRAHDAREFRAKIGYVPQDVHLFHGSVRENLDLHGTLSEPELWRALEQAGAASFVRALGGLEARITEAGRSLSGGEKRRLAIALALAQRAECLVLDEFTNGLDDKTKTGLLETIEALSREVLVIAVSHDLQAFDSVKNTRLALTR